MKLTYRIFYCFIVLFISNLTKAQSGLVADKAMVVSAR